jgi:hypothetical protein
MSGLLPSPCLAMFLFTIPPSFCLDLTQCLLSILQHVQPLIWNDREMGSYIRHVSGQWLSKHVPAPMVTYATGEMECCLCSPRQGLIKKRTGAPCQLSSAREAEKRWCYSWSRAVSCRLRVEFCMEGWEDRIWVGEAEEYPLLEAAARERLMGTQLAGKRPIGCCDDL